MQRRQLLGLAATSALAVGLGAFGLGTGAAETESGYRISPPQQHGNLAIYFVHAKSAPGPVPLTLQEAVTRGLVTVHETGSVNELQIENLGNDEVYVQSGDIVKGGKQDRVLMVSTVLPPRSGRMPIASFCVEQGRWQARGNEDVQRFSSADAALPSRRAKLAMKAPEKPRPVQAEDLAIDLIGRPHDGRGGRLVRPQQQRDGGTGSRQQQVWSSVADTQMRLAKRLNTSVAAPQSASSLQLSLENGQLKEMQRAYIEALRAKGEQGDDIVGYVFAINGKLNSGDIYPSNGLFRKMWDKLLNASVTEAIGERDEHAEALPSTEAVLAFLNDAERGKPQAPRDLTRTVKLETRENEKVLYFATERSGGGWVHRNYLAK